MFNFPRIHPAKQKPPPDDPVPWQLKQFWVLHPLRNDPIQRFGHATVLLALFKPKCADWKTAAGQAISLRINRRPSGTAKREIRRCRLALTSAGSLEGLCDLLEARVCDGRQLPTAHDRFVILEPHAEVS